MMIALSWLLSISEGGRDKVPAVTRGELAGEKADNDGYSDEGQSAAKMGGNHTVCWGGINCNKYSKLYMIYQGFRLPIGTLGSTPFPPFTPLRGIQDGAGRKVRLC
jgi:hypothetical protein